MSKKILYLFMLATFSFTFSCSKGGDLEKINKSFIVGKWKLSSATKNGVNVNLDECQLLKTLEFDTSYEVIIKTYEIGTNTSCEEKSNTTHDYMLSKHSITIKGVGDAVISTPKTETLIHETTEASDIIVKTYTRQ